MKKIKLHLLRVAMAPFAGIVHFEAFISKFVKIPMLDKLACLAFDIHGHLLYTEARLLGYKNFSELFHVTLNRIAVFEDDPAERDAYDDDWH